MTKEIKLLSVIIFLLSSTQLIAGQCLGYTGPGGACYSGPGGGLYTGPGGGLYSGPGGGMYSGPGGGLYTGPGGGLYTGPGGGIYTGPPSHDKSSYHGPWGPCITGAETENWLKSNCQNRN